MIRWWKNWRNRRRMRRSLEQYPIHAYIEDGE